MKTRDSAFGAGCAWASISTIAVVTGVATILLGAAAAPAAAQEKKAAQYTAEAKAWEAEADRLQRTAAPQRQIAPPVVVAVSMATTGTGPKVGVYGCMNQDGYEAPTLQWGILDGANYSDFDGGHGHYVYDAGTRVLTFTSGYFKGLRRLRTDDRVFRILDEHGAMTAFNCPWTPKDPRKVHW